MLIRYQQPLQHSIANIRPSVAGPILTGKDEVLSAASSVNQGIQSLRLDMAANFYLPPEDEWSNGCAQGFADAYVHGYYNLGGVQEPTGTPAYVAGYVHAFSHGNGYAMGQARAKDQFLSTDTATDALSKEDPAKIAHEKSVCSAAFDVWLATHPQSGPPAQAAAQATLRSEYLTFASSWDRFYNGLFDIGILDSGDAAIEQIRGYYNQYISFVNRYQALGFKASYVPPPPPKTASFGENLAALDNTILIAGIVIAGLFILTRGR
jgi:hypothetical protein